jgi:hypothetical protein
MKQTELSEHNVYWISNNQAIMTNLVNESTGKRSNGGQLLDNIVDKGWYLFEGIPGKMKPTTQLNKHEAFHIVREAL